MISEYGELTKPVLHKVTNNGLSDITVYTWDGAPFVVRPGDTFTGYVRTIEHGRKAANYTVKTEEQ